MRSHLAFPKLLSDNALDDPHTFKPLYHMVPDEAMLSRTFETVVGLALTLACAYSFRIGEPCERLPLSLLWVMDRPADEPCDVRKQIARTWQDNSAEELNQSLTEYFSLKVRNLWYHDIRRIAETGTVGIGFYNFMLKYRASMPAESQEIEGVNSKLRWLMQLARNIRWQTVDSRMSIQKGDLPMHTDIVAAHSQTLAWESSDAHLQRFAPVASKPACDLPKPFPPAVFRSRTFAAACAYALTVNRLFRRRGRHATFVGPVIDSTVCYLFPWGHGYSLYSISAACRRTVGGGGGSTCICICEL